MNLKKAKIISSIGIFLLCFLFHFIYEWMPSFFTAVFFPVNESIWEHVKLIFSSIIFYGIIDYIILEKNHIKYNNFFTSLFVSSITSIPIFLIIYLPLFYKLGPKMYINIITMAVAIIISQIISYCILNKKRYNKLNIISIVLIIIAYIGFAYLTYYPIKAELFFDVMEEKYGLNDYNV